MDETTDIDALVASAEASTNNEIPMEGQSPPPEAESPAPTPQEYEFEHAGQKIKAPIEKLIKWASMGYSAPNKIGELSRQLQERDGKLKQLETYEKTYRPIDDWAQKNPDKWKSLFSSWQQAQYGGVPAPEQTQAQLPPEILQKIQEHDQRWQALDQKETVQKTQMADQTLDGEIQSIRKSYPNLDFDAPDEKGNSLEYQVLEHATKNGIPSFRAAFRDYCFDQLNKLSESKGLERQMVAPKTKAGLLGKDQAPRAQGQPPPTNRTYEQLHQMALQELGIRTG